MTADIEEGITNIEWRVDGKVASITKDGGAQTIKFTYDGLGNRIAKTILPDNITTLYSRDAQGNVLAVYETNESDITNISANKAVILKEHHIYGSSRLGIEQKNLQGSFNETFATGTITSEQLVQVVNNVIFGGGVSNNFTVENTGDLTVKAGSSIVFKPGTILKGNVLAKIEPYSITPEAPGVYARTIGDKRYELSNHLGNVLSVVSDRKLVADPLNFSNFTADVLTYNDYYPFGMLLPNRHDETHRYRYGFQGQEMDDEIKSTPGSSVNYKFRMHDPRVGRFFATDPLTAKFPWYSPYQFSGNKVLQYVELEGLEEKLIEPIQGIEYKPVFEKNENLSTLNRVGNAMENTVGVAANLLADTSNAIGSLINNAYWMISGQKQYDLHTDIIAPVQDGLKDNYNYHTETPAEQQLKDTGEALTDLKNWEGAFELLITKKMVFSKSTSFSTGSYKNQGLTFATEQISYEKLLKDVENLDFSTKRNGAVFWSGPRMLDAQKWALKNGKTTLEQTPGGKYLDGLSLFDNLPGYQAAEIWDIASKKFSLGASGNLNTFSTGATKYSNWGLRTWWRIEKPTLLENIDVETITRRKKDGTKSLTGHVDKSDNP